MIDGYLGNLEWRQEDKYCYKSKEEIRNQKGHRYYGGKSCSLPKVLKAASMVTQKRLEGFL